MSDPVAFVAAIIAVVLVALIGLTIVRRTAPRSDLAQHTDGAGYIYSIILSQVVIAVWDEYRGAQTEVIAEVDTARNLDRLAQSWPGEDRRRIKAALTAYATHVYDVEWPAMARGDTGSSSHVPTVHQFCKAVDDGWVHALMTASFATLAALLLLLQYELENPFEGVSAIEPTVM